MISRRAQQIQEVNSQLRTELDARQPAEERLAHHVEDLARSLSQAGSVTAIVVGCLVLIGWMLDIATLKSVVPGLVSMKANTALAFILSGTALWLLLADRVGPRTRPIAKVCAVIVLLIGLITFGQYLFNRDFGIDQLLFKEPVGAVGTSHLGRMSPVTALNFVFVGLALLFLDTKAGGGYPLGQVFILPAAVISLLGLIGYAYDAPMLYTIAPFSSMALHTAATFMLLCAGIISARPDRGLATVFSGGESIEKKIFVGFGLALATLLGTVVVASHSILEFQETSRLVARSHEVLTEIEATLSLMKDATAGHRGYIITGDELYLEPYDAAARLIPDQLKLLRSSTADNLAQQRRLDIVEPLIAANFTLRADAIKAQKTKGIEAARMNLKTGLGKRQMDAIRQVFREMEKEEHELLSRRSAESEQSARSTIAVIVLGSLLAVALVALASVIVKRAINDRKWAEEALRESEKRFRLLMGHALDAIFYIDLDGVIQWANHQAEVMMGRPRDQVIGHNITMLLSPETAAIAEVRLAAVRRGEAVTPLVEIEFFRPDGVMVLGEANIASVQQHGKTMGRLLVVRDITKRKRAEEALRLSEAFKNRILGSSPDCIKVLDLEGRLLFMSKGGMERLEICDVTPFLNSQWVDFWKGEDKQRAGTAIAAARTGGVGRFIGFCPTTTGKPKWWDVLITPMLNASGAPDKLLSISRDITERKQAEDALRQSEEQQRQLLEDRDRISRDLHDNIIQMIYAVGLNLEECHRLIEDDPKASSRVLSRAIRALNAVIRDLRSYIARSEPKISSGQQLKAAIERLAKTMEGAHLLEFRLQVDPMAASRLTAEEVNNVLYIVREAMSNSLRHSGGRSAFVALQSRNGYVRLEVEDDGVGFDVQAKQERGTGLRNLVARAEKIGARLEVISKPGRGTRVVLNIPQEILNIPQESGYASARG